MEIKSLIRDIPDHPKKGVIFKDITTLLKDEAGFKFIIDTLSERYKSLPIDKVAAIESRGFTIGSALAYSLGKGLVILRKGGKLPGDCYSTQYELEYGFDKLEIHQDAVEKGEKVLLVDDILATGGTALGAIFLLEKLGAKVIEFCTVVSLSHLKGEKRLHENNQNHYTMCSY